MSPLKFEFVLSFDFKLSDATERMQVTKTYNMAELRRMKRQFITYSKMHPVEDGTKIGNMFVQFIVSNSR